MLLVGGSFTDAPNFDPTVARIVTDEVNIPEPLYPTLEWYPSVLGSLNRFLSIDGQSREELVVVPGQYRANGPTSAIGTERLYNKLNFVVYRAPFTSTDFLAPNIWETEAVSITKNLVFQVRASDDSGSIARVTMTYRRLSSNTWSSLDLVYDPATGWATGKVPTINEPIDYFVQAVDPSGNVALAVNHGVPYTFVRNGPFVYLPLTRR